ncbi:MAG: SNF2-related protein [Thermoguttaceae bacterium]|jgi:superfamily II DNA or RNA helicase|nr:SNF2-related protein [Thermoguttaceae bacterium]
MTQPSDIIAGHWVRVAGREDLGSGEVVRVRGAGHEMDVAFDRPDGRWLLTFPVSRLSAERDLWERLERGPYDRPVDFLLKQLALQLPLHNSGGELSNARTDLLPHQILLTHDVVAMDRRRLLIADDVGLGKTIETGMVIRELVTRGLAQRILVVCPAGLIKNWQRELRECFRLNFDVLGLDFQDSGIAWETRHRVVASIDTIKQARRMERLLAGPNWDLVIFDEAHHLTRKRFGRKTVVTQNYRLAEAMSGHTRDLLFLSATPHQGDAFQFWSLVQLLDDSLFESPETMLDHRGLLNRVMVRRIKREVTYADGTPIFMRRQVFSERFQLAARERAFYERLTDYLREGYGVAGVGQSRTSTKQRAVGFVMTAFQKIMSSSPRAIRQALRRRLLVLLIRQQIGLEVKRAQRSTDQSLPRRIVELQDDMRSLASLILGLPGDSSWAETDAYIAQMKQHLAKKTHGQITAWALDGDEDAEDVVLSDTTIPNEPQIVHELLQLVPEGTDRKFDTLVRAVEQVRAGDLDERFIVFTQYRETLEFLREELAKLYGEENIVTVKGGPLEDKIAAVECFWKPDGARFLISTSAGGEGINLQVCRVLFNYDMPWNPMAVEQRIGRIHRYGQQDTVQVYNLIAEDTIEQRIYDLLEDKLLDIARTIGKVDPITGTVAEDFRGEILGFLGSSPNYQELYRKALVDRDYRRTADELAQMVQMAATAGQALQSLAQDLTEFNLEHYRQLQGELTLADLKAFLEAAILRLGGSFIPDGDFYRIQTPEALLQHRNVAARYDTACFRRDIAMRSKSAEFMGIGHPLVDATIAHFQQSSWPGEVAVLGASDDTGGLSIRFALDATLEDGSMRRRYESADAMASGSWVGRSPKKDVEALAGAAVRPAEPGPSVQLPSLRERVSGAIADAEARFRTEISAAHAVQGRLVGLAAISAPNSNTGSSTPWPPDTIGCSTKHSD